MMSRIICYYPQSGGQPKIGEARRPQVPCTGRCAPTWLSLEVTRIKCGKVNCGMENRKVFLW